MLTKLVVGGFKAFQGLVTAELAPITLIYGRNSAGKSSLLQGLLVLGQTLRGAHPEPRLRSRGRYVDLGGYRNVAAAEETVLGIEVAPAELLVEFGVEATFRGPEGELSRLELSGHTRDGGDRVCAACRVVPDLEAPGLSGIFYDLGPDAGLRAWLAAVLGDRRGAVRWLGAREAARRALGHRSDPESLLTADEVDQAMRAAGSFVWAPADGDELLPSCAGALATARTAPATEAVRAAIEWLLRATAGAAHDVLDRIAYLGPARELPPRILVPEAGNLFDVLAREPSVLAELNGWLDRLQFGQLLEMHELSDPENRLDRVLAPRYRNVATDAIASVRDVGYGVSQAVPVIVGALLGAGQTIIVEQPELHLHPRLQAELAELFIECRRDSRFILETHSEHLALRMLHAVAQGRLNPDELSVLYVDSELEPPVRRLHVGASGDFLDHWPRGFFTERDAELFEGAVPELVEIDLAELNE